MKLYLDLDGVFADFNKKVFEITGEHSSQLTPKSLWSQLTRVDHFFATLQPLPESIEHFRELQQRSLIPIEILTGLPLQIGKFKTSEMDKRAWVKLYLDENITVNCTTRRGDKVKYIKSPTDILVDDTEFNIVTWSGAGGVGILHQDWKNTFRNLNQLGALK